MKFEQNCTAVSEETYSKMLMDRQTDTWTDEGQKVITKAHPEHSSGELKNLFFKI